MPGIDSYVILEWLGRWDNQFFVEILVFVGDLSIIVLRCFFFMIFIYVGVLFFWEGIYKIGGKW